MTRIQVLEEQKAVFTAQKAELENKRGDIYVREQQALFEALVGFYGVFSEDVEVEVTRGSVYFKMAHPNYSYKKELFNLYLREDYDFENSKISYTGIDLSYYTTSTKGVDAWELKRLQMLGKIAEVIYEKHDEIVDATNAAVFPFKAEYAEVFKEMNLINKGIRELDDKINALKSEAILTKLSSEEGVIFDIPQHIELKRTYCPRLNRIRIIGVKGKTCTVEIEIGDSYKTTESRVSIASLVDQVKHYNIL
jgi:hypothetical protein